MMWVSINHRVIGRCHVATLSTEPPLKAYIASNGAGWFNWCISPNLDDYMMENPHRIQGGAKTLKVAKVDVEVVLRKYAANVNRALGLVAAELTLYTSEPPPFDADAAVRRFGDGK